MMVKYSDASAIVKSALGPSEDTGPKGEVTGTGEEELVTMQ